MMTSETEHEKEDLIRMVDFNFKVGLSIKNNSWGKKIINLVKKHKLANFNAHKEAQGLWSRIQLGKS